MTVTALVEKLDEKRYRAVISQPFALESEAESPDEAIEKLRDLANRRLSSGRLVEIDIESRTEDNPWLKFAGIWRDHPDLNEYMESIREYRREANSGE